MSKSKLSRAVNWYLAALAASLAVYVFIDVLIYNLGV